LTEPKGCGINGGVTQDGIVIMADKGLVIKVLIRFILGLIFIGIFFFGTAGTFSWPEAWIFIGIQFSWSIGIVIWLFKHNPELLKDRMSLMKKSAKSWDKVILTASIPFYLAFLVIPGLDAVRFQWSIVPMAVKIFCFILIAVSFIWIGLVMKENTYLSRVVEIQTERGHKVITTGPYKFVRHPMYVATLVLLFCFPPALGSLYGLIPVFFAAITVVIRTHLEDKTLHKELEGYVEYAEKTKYRLIPGIW
jgi:protein-S-isoprenylcysteine O-methyltransferase Ste14